MYIIVGIASAVVISLAGYAFYLVLEVRKKQQQSDANLEEIRSYVETKKREAWRSVKILSASRNDERITLTEIAMRIKGLTQNIDLNEEYSKILEPILALATATSALPISDEWDTLSQQQKLKYKSQRLKAEARFSDDLEPALAALAASEYDDVLFTSQ